MRRKKLPHGTWHDVCDEIKYIWYSRDDELEEEVFESIPDWMQPTEERKYTENRDNKIICDLLKVRLTETEFSVIYCRFNKGLTLRKVAEEHNLSAGRIQQIEAKALRKMRGQMYRSPQALLWLEKISEWFEKLESDDKKKILGGEKYAAYFKREEEEKERKRIEREEYYKWVRQLELAQEQIEREKKQRIEEQIKLEHKNKRANFLKNLDSFDSILLRELRSIAAEQQDVVVLEKIAIILYCRKVQKSYANFEQKA
jgi:hypothetical protein